MPFHTRRAVLQRDGGLLAVLASGDFPPGEGADGCTFVDRDPVWFPLVLAYLHSGAPQVP